MGRNEQGLGARNYMKHSWPRNISLLLQVHAFIPSLIFFSSVCVHHCINLDSNGLGCGCCPQDIASCTAACCLSLVKSRVSSLKNCDPGGGYCLLKEPKKLLSRCLVVECFRVKIGYEAMIL